ncbi:MAG: class I SAM-dependent methyltransferase [Candidatus Odinarchaeota archaeon]
MKNKKQSNLDFKCMSFFFKIRDIFHNPIKKINNADIRQGETVLDYGCGPGSYSLAAAEKIGTMGKLIAADIHPLALQKVRKKAKKMGYSNIETIQTECDTKLDDESIDRIICFDVFHGISNKNNIINEFYRVLKPNSILSLDDHHYNEDQIIDFIASKGLFKLADSNDKQYNFIKI